jgi:hypothetical protein
VLKVLFILIIKTNKNRREKMTELTEAHFELHSANKDRMYQKRKQAEEILKELLNKFKTDDLIDMLMKLDQEQD